MTSLITDNVCSPSVAARPARGSVAKFVTAALATYRSRRKLAQLAPHMLEDIGLSAQDARFEAERPVWNVPHSWLR